MMIRPTAARGSVVLLALLTALSAATGARAAETPANAGAATVVAAAAAGAVLAKDARVVGDGERTRFIADLDRKVDMAAFTLADPYRVVVDLPEVSFALAHPGEGRGLVSAFRYGQISPGKSRIVIDVDKPVKIDKAFVTEPLADQPARLVVDMVPTTREAFLAAAIAYRKDQAPAAAQRLDPPPDTAGRLVVVIDPGHGGIDSGARGDKGSLEKDITLAFSQVLADSLQATGLYDVFLTRKDDSFVALGDRVAFARAHHADLFLSVHANSFLGGAVRGATVYTVSEEASDKMAADLAASENQSDVLAGLDMDEGDSDEVKDILLDLTRRETRNFGVTFARNLVSALKVNTKMFKYPHQKAGFKVLEAPDVPSALLELGYLSNDADEKLLLSQEWRETTAKSVVQGIADYFGKRTKEAAAQ